MFAFGKGFLGGPRFSRLGQIPGVPIRQTTRPVNTPEAWPARTEQVGLPQATWTTPVGTTVRKPRRRKR